MSNKSLKTTILNWLALLTICVFVATGCSEKTSEDTATTDENSTMMADSSQTEDNSGMQEDEDEMTPADTPEEQPMEDSDMETPETMTAEAPKATKPAPAAELVPLDIELPEPMFVGTPQNFRVERLEKPLGKPRPPFLAPAGTKNVALKKPVTSSDNAPIIGSISMITDGDKNAAEGSYVELGPFKQHVTVDLGGKYNIYAILVWHFHEQPRVYYDVIVQVADDPQFTSNVETIFNNDHDNSAGLGAGEDLNYVETSEGKLIDAKGVQGRYVRLYSNGNTNNDLNHYIEVAVYGKPAAAM